MNECDWLPCKNGGWCRDLQPPRKYECVCPKGYTGINCEMEMLASGIITPSRDFILAVVICFCALICKYSPVAACLFRPTVSYLSSPVTVRYRTGEGYEFPTSLAHLARCHRYYGKVVLRKLYLPRCLINGMRF